MPVYALIGASRGIGLELARQLSANAENTVLVTARNKQKTPFLQDLQKQRSGNLHIIEADVMDHVAMERAAAEAAKITGGRIDVLVQNAARMERENGLNGFLDYETFEKLEYEFKASFDVNVLGLVRSVNAFLPLLRKGTQKKIVVIGTEMADTDVVWKARVSGVAAYGVTKAAEHMVAIKYAAELEPEGFTVVAVSPGMVDVSATATEPMVTEAQLPMAMKVMGGIQAAYPKAANFTPEESARRLVSFMQSVGPTESGLFHRSPHFA